MLKDKIDSHQGPYEDIPDEHISVAVTKALDIIDKRRRGLLMGLRTCWAKLNRYVGGGIQEATQYVIAGRSGVGKSAFVNLLIKSLFDFNPKCKIVILYFNFEMPNYKQVVRKMSKELGLTVNQILSSDKSLSSDDYQKLKDLQTSLSKYDIYFVDIPVGTSRIYKKILDFHRKFPDRHLINVFDHSRLVTDENERDEMTKIGRLSKMGMLLKKKLNCTNIIVSQLNRNIENMDRAKNLHEPMASDVFGADSLVQDADVVLIPHRPETFRIANYFGYDTKDFIALHIIKNRDGETGFIPFKHNLAINSIEEL